MSENMSSLKGRPANSTEENLKAAVMNRLTLPPRDVCDRLRAAVANAATRDADSMDALRGAVEDFTVALRAARATPEMVLISLKALITMGALSPRARDDPDWAGHVLRETMSSWCIAAYFSDRST